MRPTKKQIEEIAENLECGLRCFYHLKTGELKTMLNFEDWVGADEELWEEVAEEIDESRDDYFEFEGFASHESFQIMADFAENIDNVILQGKLRSALGRHKPFANFKWEIDNSGAYRQQWFDFKKMRYIQWVTEQIDMNNQYFGEQLANGARAVFCRNSPGLYTGFG